MRYSSRKHGVICSPAYSDCQQTYTTLHRFRVWLWKRNAFYGWNKKLYLVWLYRLCHCGNIYSLQITFVQQWTKLFSTTVVIITKISSKFNRIFWTCSTEYISVNFWHNIMQQAYVLAYRTLFHFCCNLSYFSQVYILHGLFGLWTSRLLVAQELQYWGSRTFNIKLS